MFRIEKQYHRKTLFVYFLLLFFLFLLSAETYCSEITDMFGNTVSIPNHPVKVFSTSPSVTYMLYAIDPSMVAGLNFPLRENQKKYMPDHFKELPVLGGWFGQAAVPNLEMVLKVNPELVIVSKHRSAMDENVNETMRIMPMPVINIPLDKLEDYVNAFIYLGKILGREKRGRELADYASKTLSEMKALTSSISLDKVKTVYYAEGVDGLYTECDSSKHAELIPRAGGRNVHGCISRDLFGKEKISFEKIMLYDPDVILVMEKNFFSNVFKNPLWKKLRAVRDGKVYMIPHEPFSWFDRPPCFMRFLGIRWLASILYPEEYGADIITETQEFFRIFLKIELEQENASRILGM